MVGGQLVGSAGTGTNAFQLLKDNKITFKNGSIVGATEGSKPADDTPNWHGAPAIVIQNYCDLTLDNMTVTGGDETVYTMSNNCGNVVIKDTTINAKNGDVAFDVCRYASYPSVNVTVKGNSTINGTVEVSGVIGEGQSRQLNIEGGSFAGDFRIVDDVPANISITGGTFNTDVSAYVADGYTYNSETKTVEPLGETNAVAKVGDTYYKTLADAVTAAENGETVTLLKNAEMTETIRITDGKKITLALDGHDVVIKTTGKFFLVRNGELTVTGTGMIKEETPYFAPIIIKGGAEKSENYSVVNVEEGVILEGWAGVMIDQTSNTTNNYGMVLNVNGATLKGVKDTDNAEGLGVYVNGVVADAKVTLNNATLTADGYGMYLAGNADTTITGGTVSGTTTGIEIRAGKLTLDNCDVTGGSGEVTKNANGNGSTVNNAALAISQHTTKKDIDVTINGGTYTCLLYTSDAADD